MPDAARVTTRFLLAVLAVAAAVVLKSGAPVHAAPTCTSTWTGGGGDARWNNADNGSPAAVPGPGDHACVAAAGGTLTIVLDGASATVGSVDIAEGLNIQSGSLSLAGTDDSTIARLAITGGELTGAGNVTVGDTLSWTGGRMTGSGTTTILAGAGGPMDQ